MKTKNFFRYFPARQTLSTGLALTLLVTGPAAPWLESSSMPQTLWAERREQRLNQSKSSSPVFPVSRPAGLQIDKELGFVTHSYHPFANDVLSKRNRTNQIPIILHFQEVHGNPSAQQNLATLLPNLSRQFLRTGTTQPLLITVEGAWGPLKTEWFRTLPDTNYRDTLAQLFLQTGWMTGEEFLAATNDDLNVHVVGVEDPILFEENTRARHDTDNERLAMGHLLGTYFSPLKQGAMPSSHQT
jgi:hypothetical protein